MWQFIHSEFSKPFSNIRDSAIFILRYFGSKAFRIHNHASKLKNSTGNPQIVVFNATPNGTKITEGILPQGDYTIPEGVTLLIPGDKDNNHATIRVYKQRETVNLVCLMSGKMPEVDNEIALDRMYADNSGIKVGDTISIGGRTLVVSGLIAMPDYSCLFEKNSDMMFDAINFSVAVMTNQAFEAFQSVHMTYNYAWNYAQKVERTDVEKADKLSETFLDDLTKEIKLKHFLH